jgi:hypothetical protein
LIDWGDKLDQSDAAGQNISHLFGTGTTVLIGPVWFLCLFLDRSAGPIGSIPAKTPENQPKQKSILNFRPLRTRFEEEAAISTPSVIHPWKALVKPEF